MLICIALLLALIGFIFIYSASALYAHERLANPHYYVKRQLIGFICSIVGFFIARTIPLPYIKKYTPLFFVSTLILTSLTLVPFFGTQIHGSSRWLSFFRFSFQPSELLKIGFIMYVAYFLTRKEHKRKQPWYKSYIPFLLVLAVTSIILLKQPDFGLTVTLLASAFILLFIADFHLRATAFTLLSLIPFLLLLIIMRPYRLKRVMTFLDPWADPDGAGFQIIQSLIAIGSGHITGVGIAQSKQKLFYLPMQHTDFIFSIIAEETGFIGALGLLMLFIAFLYCGMKLACLTTDRFSKLTIAGFTSLITLEALINAAVVTGLVPTKGIGLPFISYGNTALVSNALILGLIVNMAYSKNEA